MPVVDLVYDPECPNAGLTRSNLERAFSLAGVEAAWQEHRIGDPEAPRRVLGYGSPTVLVDGFDVAGVAPHDANCCRVYGMAGGLSGAPSIEQIAGALRAAVDSMR